MDLELQSIYEEKELNTTMVVDACDTLEIAGSSGVSSMASSPSEVAENCRQRIKTKATPPRNGDDAGGSSGGQIPVELTQEQIKLFQSLTLEQRKALFASSSPGNEERVESETTAGGSDDGLSIDEVTRFELFRSVIEHEDELLNQRVSWIILAQSFLMAAFITSDGSDSLRYVTAITGLLTVVVTFPAIYAAGQNIEIQQQVYFLMLQSDERCQLLHGHTRDIATKDAGEMQRRIGKGHMFPSMAFRGDWGVPILITVVSLVAVQFLGWIFLLIALISDWQ